MFPINKQIYYFGNNLKPKDIFEDVYSKDLERYIENVKYIYAHHNNILFILNSDHVFGRGLNYNGILGLGNNNCIVKPTLISELCKKQIKHFYNGRDFILSLNSKSDEIYG